MDVDWDFLNRNTHLFPGKRLDHISLLFFPACSYTSKSGDCVRMSYLINISEFLHPNKCRSLRSHHVGTTYVELGELFLFQFGNNTRRTVCKTYSHSMPVPQMVWSCCVLRSWSSGKSVFRTNGNFPLTSSHVSLPFLYFMNISSYIETVPIVHQALFSPIYINQPISSAQ